MAESCGGYDGRAAVAGTMAELLWWVCVAGTMAELLWAVRWQS